MDITSDSKNDTRAKRHRLESDLLIFSADHTRFLHKHEEFALEIKRLENDVKRLTIVIEEKKVAQQKLAREIAIKEEEMAHIKKQMNSL